MLQFAFDGDGTNVHRPHNHYENSICYPGTHDNDTAVSATYQSPASLPITNPCYNPSAAVPGLRSRKSALKQRSRSREIYLQYRPWRAKRRAEMVTLCC